MLLEFILIPLDIFARIRQNKEVKTFNQLEAWITFLSTDKPKVMIDLKTLNKKVLTYPIKTFFHEMQIHIFVFCLG